MSANSPTIEPRVTQPSKGHSFFLLSPLPFSFSLLSSLSPLSPYLHSCFTSPSPNPRAAEQNPPGTSKGPNPNPNSLQSLPDQPLKDREAPPIQVNLFYSVSASKVRSWSTLM